MSASSASSATAEAAEPRIASSVPGRLRLRMQLDPGRARAVEMRLDELPGVRWTAANPATGSVLVQYEPAALDPARIAAAAAHARPVPADARRRRRGPRLPALEERVGAARRLRVAVPALERNPELARAVLDRLREHPGVRRAVASPLTGRVLVELSETTVELQDILSRLADVDLPDVPDDEAPAHPLDLEPLVQAGARLAGATLGLAVVAAERALGGERVIHNRTAAWAAAMLGTVESFPPLRALTRALVGKTASDVLFTAAGVTALTFAGSPLGLAVTAAGALRSFTELRARRSAWIRYELAIGVDEPEPGTVLRLAGGEAPPLDALVREGRGTVTGVDAVPRPVAQGERIAAGSVVNGGPLLVELLAEPAYAHYEPPPRPEARVDRYITAVGPAALFYAGLTALLTRSLERTLISFLLVNPRPAVIGKAAAARGASARAVRAGAVVVGSRRHRIELPDTLVVRGLRPLTEGLELAELRPLAPHADASVLIETAAAVTRVTGNPWGWVLGAGPRGADGSFDGAAASARVRGSTWRLVRRDDDGAALTLELRHEDDAASAVLTFRPRAAQGVDALARSAAAHHVQLVVALESPPSWAATLAERIGASLEAGSAETVLAARETSGEHVAVLVDAADAGPALDESDLGIALSTERRGPFEAPADVLVPDLGAAAAVLEAAARSRAAARDSAVLAAAANVAGAAWGLRREPGLLRASTATNVATLAALADGYMRLRGGARPWSVARLLEPQPERWAELPLAELLRDLETRPEGLTAAEAARRQRRAVRTETESPLAAAVQSQLTSPVTALLAAGALASFALGAVADVAVIGAVVVANMAVSAWQERQAATAAAALDRLSSPRARVLRDGREVLVAAQDVVVGDVLVLGPGDRVAADARLLRAWRLEVDESSLTGESQPVPKAPDAPEPADRIVLAGSDVTVGRGTAVVVAVGRETRLGAIAAALELAGRREGGLASRLDAMFREILPLVGIAAGLVLAAGLLRRRPLLPQVAVATTVAIAALPEGLPLLTGVAEASAARRLAGRGALVRRLAAIESLGRVDVACVDKTGTLTEGRLRVSLVADVEGTEAPPGPGLDERLVRVLAAAALASPHPESPDASSHPTDRAVLEAAAAAGLSQAETARAAESPFDPARGFHATASAGRVAVKGAPEELVDRCRVTEEERARLLARADELAARGLRVLLVAEGAGDVDDPRELEPLGFVGIGDPLRPGVREAVERCRAAGVRAVMLTGDHPLTARAVAAEAGMLDGGDVLTGEQLSGLEDAELDARLESAVAIARITPLDKVRIVERLQHLGHVVAMTGDGVNDAPALRLADVGVAMGRHGTEVARGAADIVLADDRFETLVDALVEGRSFWRNIRRALALLLGGNLGELGLIVGAELLGRAAPLTPRQILAVNLVTDVLPAVAVAAQAPRSNDLADLAREGLAGLEGPLRAQAARRGAATAVPALAAYLAAAALLDEAQARGVAFASIVTTQLAQTVDVGRTEGALTRPVQRAVTASGAALAAGFVLPPVRAFLALARPAPLALLLAAAATAAAPPLGRRSRGR